MDKKQPETQDSTEEKTPEPKSVEKPKKKEPLRDGTIVQRLAGKKSGKVPVAWAVVRIPGTANKVFALELDKVSYQDCRIMEPSKRPESLHRALIRIEDEMYKRSRRAWGFESAKWNSRSSKFGEDK